MCTFTFCWSSCFSEDWRPSSLDNYLSEGDLFYHDSQAFDYLMSWYFQLSSVRSPWAPAFSIKFACQCSHIWFIWFDLCCVKLSWFDLFWFKKGTPSIGITSGISSSWHWWTNKGITIIIIIIIIIIIYYIRRLFAFCLRYCCNSLQTELWNRLKSVNLRLILYRSPLPPTPR